MKKFTLASAKSFIKRNRANLLIKCVSSFDGMTDCVERNPDASWKPRLNIHGEVIGFECYNCCGNFELKVK